MEVERPDPHVDYELGILPASRRFDAAVPFVVTYNGEMQADGTGALSMCRLGSTTLVDFDAGGATA